MFDWKLGQIESHIPAKTYRLNMHIYVYNYDAENIFKCIKLKFDL